MFKWIKAQMAFKRATQANARSNKLIRYLVSAQNWSINHDGECLMANLPKPIGELTISHSGVHQGIFHFGGIADALSHGKVRWPNVGIGCGLTWFHVLKNDKRLKLVPALDKQLDFWHSSCQSTLDTLIAHGATATKTHCIPLGVDTEVFTVATPQKKLKFRQQLGIDEDAVVIGSFQKDGRGWNNGQQAKMEKGPDVLCDVLETLAKSHKLFVLLSGPARGYVKNRLRGAGIAFYHTGYLPHANDVAPYFQALDIYLIPSRIEGGPKACLEAPACGIPLVSTSVGMVPDIIKHGRDALVAKVGDTDSLIAYCEAIIQDPNLAATLAQNGRVIAEKHSWKNIAQRYYDELYQPMLERKNSSL
ncbi:glycosyltransferase family 4 protein [uncultured Paraglaciecola sp.]|uniref:glycosyltransferase family 4 protein n=1 Tax=uncultured Paraglaciecola sp. TaxID=1765024 RepID=UPI0030DB5184|tara:strand:+ start:18631 stop:19716 length:1086 start_codon:yes stop_codon:yes gene_type:complete